jgi:hypothetical protein
MPLMLGVADESHVGGAVVPSTRRQRRMLTIRMPVGGGSPSIIAHCLTRHTELV